MRKLGRLISGILICALALVAAVAVTGCDNDNDAAQDGVYTVEVPGALAEWQYGFVNISKFGDEHWGMINLEDWGNKKLKLGPNGTCVGVGCKWTVKLDVSNKDYYELYIIAHLIGDGQTYDGEGDYVYMLRGEYTAVEGGYELKENTYGEVSLTEGFELITDGYDFADYIPTGPWKITSEMSDEDAFVTTNNNNTTGTRGLQDKLWPSTLTSTVFGGATFKVSNGKITSVEDVNFPM